MEKLLVLGAVSSNCVTPALREPIFLGGIWPPVRKYQGTCHGALPFHHFMVHISIRFLLIFRKCIDTIPGMHLSLQAGGFQCRQTVPRSNHEQNWGHGERTTGSNRNEEWRWCFGTETNEKQVDVRWTHRFCEATSTWKKDSQGKNLIWRKLSKNNSQKES